MHIIYYDENNKEYVLKIDDDEYIADTISEVIQAAEDDGWHITKINGTMH